MAICLADMYLKGTSDIIKPQKKLTAKCALELFLHLLGLQPGHHCLLLYILYCYLSNLFYAAKSVISFEAHLFAAIYINVIMIVWDDFLCIFDPLSSLLSYSLQFY